MNILVTGASGFVGSHLLEHLAAHLDANCVGVTRTPSHKPDTVFCELTDYRQVDDLIETVRPGVIYHVAGSFSNDFETDYANNVIAAKNILEATLKHRHDAHVLLMGSAAEYGRVKDWQNPVSEQQALKPISVYGWTKAAQTLLASLYAGRYGLNVMVARTFNLSGKGMSKNLFTGRVEQQIRDFQAGRTDRITVGNLDARRDYIDIASACDMYLAITSRGTPGEVYNVGSGVAVSMRELLEGMLQEAGLDASIIHEIQDQKPASEVGMIYADTSKVSSLMK